MDDWLKQLIAGAIQGPSNLGMGPGPVKPAGGPVQLAPITATAPAPNTVQAALAMANLDPLSRAQAAAAFKARQAGIAHDFPRAIPGGVAGSAGNFATDIASVDLPFLPPLFPGVRKAGDQMSDAAQTALDQFLGATPGTVGTDVGHDVGSFIGPMLTGAAAEKLATRAVQGAAPLSEAIAGKFHGLRQGLADAIAPDLASERRNMARLAHTDDLTGLGNQRDFERALPTAEADPGTQVVTFDANNFGQVNKIANKRTGDMLLQHQASAIKQAMREAGVPERAFRSGIGDEMTAFVPTPVAERVRMRAEQLFGEHDFGPYKVSLTGNTGANFAEADAGLQEAKAIRKARAPNTEVQQVAQSLKKSAPLPRATAVNEAHASEMARAYEGLKNDPTNPEVQNAYHHFVTETEAQRAALEKAGYKFEVVDQDPYKNSAEMMRDVRDNKTIKILRTPEGAHPILTPEQNDTFRGVHDIIGHAAEGNQFGPLGEERAYRAHLPTYSPEAQRVMATETRGQNSFVNYGPGKDLPAAERPFAEQKAALWPEEHMGEYNPKPEIGSPEDPMRSERGFARIGRGAIDRPRAAIRYKGPDGKWVTHESTWHPGARMEMEDQLGEGRTNEMYHSGKVEEGFVIGKNRWLDRKQALEQAKAGKFLTGRAVEPGQRGLKSENAPPASERPALSNDMIEPAEIKPLSKKLQEKFAKIMADERGSIRLPGAEPTKSYKVFHGTNQSFDQLKANPLGHWFSDKESSASRFGKTVKPAEIQLKNPRIYENDGEHMAELDDPKEIARLRKQGHDGVIVRNDGKPTNYMILDPAQAKMKTPASRTIGREDARPSKTPIGSPNLSFLDEPSPFDLSDKTLSKVPDVPQFALAAPQGPGTEATRANVAQVEKRIKSAAYRKGVERGVASGEGTTWYGGTDQLKNRFTGELGQKEGKAAFDQFMDLVAATSPGSTVKQNIRLASKYQELAMTDPAKLIHDLRNGTVKLPEGYMHRFQSLLNAKVERVLSGGLDPVVDPKTSRFAEALKGNQENIPIDVHMSRNLNLTNTAGTPLEQPESWQYAPIENALKAQAGKMGLTPAQYMANAWVGHGGPADSRAFMRMFDQSLGTTASKLGMSKDRVLKLFVRGALPLYGVGGAGFFASDAYKRAHDIPQGRVKDGI